MGIWHPLPQGPFFRSARLDCALSRTTGALLCEREGERLLAFPYDENAPFPLAEMFCFACVEEVEGKRCVVYHLNYRNAAIFREK